MSFLQVGRPGHATPRPPNNPYAPPDAAEGARLAAEYGPLNPTELRLTANGIAQRVEYADRWTYGHLTAARLRLLADALDRERAQPRPTQVAFDAATGQLAAARLEIQLLRGQLAALRDSYTVDMARLHDVVAGLLASAQQATARAERADAENATLALLLAQQGGTTLTPREFSDLALTLDLAGTPLAARESAVREID